MLLLLLSCVQEPLENEMDMEPVAIFPLNDDLVSSEVIFRGDIPSGIDSGTIAIIVWDDQGEEQEYILLETTGEFSYQSEVEFEADREYCWTAWYYPVASLGDRFTPHCFYVDPD